MGRRGIKEIEDFLKKVEDRYNPEKILVFGSRARDNHLTTSDYDVLIVSKKFEGVHFLERISRLLALWEHDEDIDILPYTPEEFARKKEEIGIVAEAVKEGIEITM